MKSLMLILIALLFLSFAEAKTATHALNPVPETGLETVLVFSDFAKLSTENQEFYVAELQRLALEIQKEDDQLHTDYQTAQHWLSMLVEEAVAGEQDRPCIYAGWISSLDINGRSCLRPKSDGCTRSLIQCNPMLYGTGRCVPATRGATAACERAKKPISQVASEIRGREQAWSNMREELSNYCKDPRPTQAKVCATIRTRLARLERVIGRVPRPKFETQARAVRTTSASAPAPKSEVGSSSGPQASASAPALSLTRSSGDCNASSLLANLRAESSTTMASVNFMNLESARTLMCSTDPIPSNWVNTQRSVILKASKNIRGSDKYARADRINYQGVLNNFNSCVRDAETLRRTGAGSVTGAYAAVVETGDFVKIFDENNRPIVALGSRFDLEGLLRSKGLSICNLRTQDQIQLAPAYSGAAPSRASTSGRAQ
jgi:hypothetical protein